MSLAVKKARMDSPEKENTITGDRDNLEIGVEEQDQLHLFPACNVSEVWLNVFEKLDAKDKPAFSRACTDWHEWVDSKRPLLLFPEVAPILMTNLQQSTLLQSRELCQSLTRELDTQVQSLPSYLYLDFELAAAERPSGVRQRNVFTTTEQIQRFLEEMKEHKGNPFPGRTLVLEPDVGQLLGAERNRMCTNYWRFVDDLVERFGTHVYQACITIWCHHGHMTGLTRLLVLVSLGNCLNLLPHLRSLYIEGQTGLAEHKIRSYFRTHPLPQLENLEMMKFNQVDPSLLNTVLHSCCVPAKIKRFWVESCQFGRLSLCETVSHFPNLEALAFRGDSLSVQDFERFCNRPREVLPPLRELELYFFTPFSPSFERLFTALETFHETLVHFRVKSWTAPAVVRSDWRINLPNLKSLYFFNYRGPLEPLQQLSALKNLTITHPSGFEHVDQMYQSNIWTLIPSLETLIVREKKFERVVFEQQRRAEARGLNKSDSDAA